MSQVCVRCQVLETPVEEGRRFRGGEWPRDLLPWADPYIAGLMDKLERRYGLDDFTDDEPQLDEPAAKASTDDAWWHDDAFMPPRHGRATKAACPPVYGGWPLLDD